MKDSNPLWDLKGTNFEIVIWIAYAIGIIWLVTSNLALDAMDLIGIKKTDEEDDAIITVGKDKKQSRKNSNF